MLYKNTIQCLLMILFPHLSFNIIKGIYDTPVQYAQRAEAHITTLLKTLQLQQSSRFRPRTGTSNLEQTTKRDYEKHYHVTILLY
jgi:hypothetical protein